ncbi:hypothetical protein STEG23_031117, partial [Scotinomys teguina]
VQLRVGGASPGQVVLSTIRKQQGLNSYFGLPSHVVLLWNSLGLLLCYADLMSKTRGKVTAETCQDRGNTLEHVKSTNKISPSSSRQTVSQQTFNILDSTFFCPFFSNSLISELAFWILDVGARLPLDCTSSLLDSVPYAL